MRTQGATQEQGNTYPTCQVIQGFVSRSAKNHRRYGFRWSAQYCLPHIASRVLCPSSSLCISPRCYPPLVDLSRVDKLDWCQFVVEQLVDAASKIDKKNSVRSCLLLLVILYIDSLDVPNLQVSPRKPRAAAWTRKMLDQVIKLDTNRDGSYGKLKATKDV